jgi:ABC-type transport system involved in cytochrome bd biosynthesis fused ATPase/permease subunit
VSDDIRRLLRWVRRAQPPLFPLLGALLGSLVATATNVGLLVGAVGLLVDSASRPGLRAVAGVLIVIELLAFLRSPIRFVERLSSHRLGFAAVTRWRRWLVATIGQWNYSKWRTYASGDLLERALRDTDELQDLWLRCVIPSFGVLATLLLSDVFVGLLPPHGQWWTYAFVLVALQILGLAGLFANVGPLIRADRALRVARGAYQAMLVELSAVTPELALLGRGEVVEQRSHTVREALSRAEQLLLRQRRASSAIGLVVTVAAVVVLRAHHPVTSPIWIVVVTFLSLSTFEALSVVRAALDTAVAISAASERLESLESKASTGSAPWPGDTALRVSHLVLEEEGTTLLDDGSFALRAGGRLAITGPSGSGKSTLLRALARLDVPASGEILLGQTHLEDIDEEELRQRLIYVPSEPGLTRGFAQDVVFLGRSPQRDAQSDLARLGLPAGRETRWEELSRGERERVAVVRAMVTSPVVLLLDEPTSGLGQEETRAVLDLLSETGASVIVATHDPQVMAWCDFGFEIADAKLRVVNR